jgi:orotidine-5'-phosphate decarboxylase
MTWKMPVKQGLMPACDLDLSSFENLVRDTADLPFISGYKIGFGLGLGYGLPKVVEVARRYTDKPLIYDHQKAATDIPATGTLFAKTMKEAGIDVAILFPQAGPTTQLAWTEALQAEGVGVIVGGWMSHHGYTSAEGGHLSRNGILRIYQDAAKAGVTEFVGPGNKPDIVAELRALLEAEGISPTFYMPGLITQGGSISEAGAAAGESWHAIVGRAITTSSDFRQACIDLWPQAT